MTVLAMTNDGMGGWCGYAHTHTHICEANILHARVARLWLHSAAAWEKRIETTYVVEGGSIGG